jgi:hypothetical protein
MVEFGVLRMQGAPWSRRGRRRQPELNMTVTLEEYRGLAADVPHCA